MPRQRGITGHKQVWYLAKALTVLDFLVRYAVLQFTLNLRPDSERHCRLVELQLRVASVDLSKCTEKVERVHAIATPDCPLTGLCELYQAPNRPPSEACNLVLTAGSASPGCNLRCMAPRPERPVPACSATYFVEAIRGSVLYLGYVTWY